MDSDLSSREHYHLLLIKQVPEVHVKIQEVNIKGPLSVSAIFDAMAFIDIAW